MQAGKIFGKVRQRKRLRGTKNRRKKKNANILFRASKASEENLLVKFFRAKG